MKESMLNLIKRNWAGEEKLWKVFWVWNFLVINILDVLAIIVIFSTLFPVFLFFAGINDTSVTVTYSLRFSDIILAIIGFCYTIFVLVYTIWAIVSLWRSAFNSSNKIWGYMARCWIVFQLSYSIVFPILGTIYPDSIFNGEDEIIIESTYNNESEQSVNN